MNGKLLRGMKTPLAVRIADKKRAKQINNRIAEKNPALFQKIVAEARIPAIHSSSGLVHHAMGNDRSRRGYPQPQVRGPRPRSSGLHMEGATYPYSINAGVYTNPTSQSYASPHPPRDHELRQREQLHHFSHDQMYSSSRSGPGSFRQQHPMRYQRQQDISYPDDSFVLDKPVREIYTDLNPTAPEFVPKSLLNDPLPLESAVLSPSVTGRELLTPSPSPSSAHDVPVQSAPQNAEDLQESIPADTEVLEYSLFGNTTFVPLVGRRTMAVEDSTYPLFANLKSAWSVENTSTSAVPDVPPGYSKSPVPTDSGDCTEALDSSRGLSQGRHAPLSVTPPPPGFRPHARPSAPRLSGRSPVLIVSGLPLQFTDEMLMSLVTAHSAVYEVRIDFRYPFHIGKMKLGDKQSWYIYEVCDERLSVHTEWLLILIRCWRYDLTVSTFSDFALHVE